MSITVKFFANLREQYNLSEKEVDYQEGITVPELWTLVTEGQDLPKSLMIAVNMQYSKMNTELADGDEVAFFPPVSGG